MNYFNLPNQIDTLLRSVPITRPKTTWYNLPVQLRAIKVQLLILNEELENRDLTILLNSIPNANWFNYLSVANKIKIAITIINDL